MEFIILFFIIWAIFAILGKLFKLSLRVMKKLFLNALSGFILLFILNFFGRFIGLTIEINLLNTIIVGVFGIFGIIFLLIMGW